MYLGFGAQDYAQPCLRFPLRNFSPYSWQSILESKYRAAKRVVFLDFRENGDLGEPLQWLGDVLLF